MNKKASLTSNHSVAPTLPYSPPLQLAKTMLRRSLNLSVRENVCIHTRLHGKSSRLVNAVAA